MSKFIIIFMIVMAVQYFAVGGLLIWNGNWQLGTSYIFYGFANVALSFLV